MEEQGDDPEWLQSYEKPALELSSSPSGSEKGDDDVHDNADGDQQMRREIELGHFEDEDDSAGPRKRLKVADESEVLAEESPVENLEQPSFATEQEDVDGAAAQSSQFADEAARKPGEKKPKPKMMSALPLVFADKVSCSKILIEGEGDALDLSGDIGAVGRISVSGKANPEVYFDLKGTIYSTSIVSSNSFFLVNIGPSEAKVEAIMNDFVQLRPDTNTNDVETMMEGTMDGITFDSDDEQGVKPGPGPESKQDAPNPAAKAKAPKAKTSTGTKAPTKITAKKPTKRGGKASTSRRGASKKAK